MSVTAADLDELLTTPVGKRSRVDFEGTQSVIGPSLDMADLAASAMDVEGPKFGDSSSGGMGLSYWKRRYGVGSSSAAITAAAVALMSSGRRKYYRKRKRNNCRCYKSRRRGYSSTYKTVRRY